MADEPHDKPVHVTGQERTHPAYRLLARAMLALARLKGGQKTEDSNPAEGENEGQDEEAGNG
jgi:hypothetical protein